MTSPVPLKNLVDAVYRETVEGEEEFRTHALYGADPDCDHEIVTLWSGVKCKKCSGWFCY